MRMLPLAILFLAVTSIAATAEPPPHQSPAPVVAYATDLLQHPGEPAYAAAMFTVRLNAAIVTQVDTGTVDTSRATSESAQAASSGPTKDGGHGLGFWLLVALLCLAVIALGIGFLRRDRVSEDELPDRTPPPGSSGRGRS